MITPYYSHHISPHISAYHTTRMNSPFKTVLRKTRDKYQAYCTMYNTHYDYPPWRHKTHLRDLNLNVEDAMHINNDNESTYGLDSTIPLGGPEEEGYPNDPICSNQVKLMELMREINVSCLGVNYCIYSVYCNTQLLVFRFSFLRIT